MILNVRKVKSEPELAIYFKAFCLQTRKAILAQRRNIQGGPKSKPLPNDQKIVLNRIKGCH